MNVGRNALGDRWDILSSLSVRDAVARRPEMASTWTELRRLSIDSALYALRREGLDSLSVESSGEPFRYTLVTTPVREGHAITFVCRVGDDPPVLLPCTMTAGQAFVQYAQRMSGQQLKPDMSALAGRSGEARLVVAHVLDSERTLGNLTG